ncbi:nitrate reductase molybdenum cofactor assembly chaperone [Mycolicibacterium fallax]|jgi:nitrate reductase delta subunit|uniref:Nitrate reductase n=1 Tax=Mycolicibacterium fallax TaxID=1793 RepID=A0A1X1RGL9_MYCFA|nr:nitrate reductase molybdenum cofactor assembly chaperone [Mycolicibacterium fallax]ORV05501.1 nitrate reductase [Mycolicibacterium fallax]BBY96968.1 nitrate reductase delta subunit [Mycolicibacterium fallax]HOW95660.1 nitrate reductase molybdenum cofactor assembly chaperone [Mycolicibacterium fallax]
MTVAEIPVVRMDSATRAGAHMLASLLLDYPDDAWFARLPELRRHAVALPAGVGDELTGFIDAALSTDPLARQRDYVGTFDLKRKCSMYLSYYATGDTRRRGAALVAFLEAYRAAGWEFDAAELPDYLPAVLEFSARSGSPIAGALLAAHRDGIEVLRTALEGMASPWAAVIRAVAASLPPVDAATRARVLALVNDGPPVETVGLNLPMPTFGHPGSQR